MSETVILSEPEFFVFREFYTFGSFCGDFRKRNYGVFVVVISYFGFEQPLAVFVEAAGIYIRRSLSFFQKSRSAYKLNRNRSEKNRFFTFDNKFGVFFVT